MADGTDDGAVGDGQSGGASAAENGDTVGDASGGHSDAESGALGPDWRVLAVAVLCLAALVGLAAIAPALADSPVGPERGGTGNETGEGTGQNGSGQSSGQQSGGQQSGARTAGPGGSVGGSTLPQQSPIGGPISESAYRNAGSQLVLVAESRRPAYWRMGAYDTYRNGRWVRSDDVGSLTPRDVRRNGGDRLTQDVWLNASMRTLPGAWRPTDVSVDGSGSASVSADGRIRADGWLPAGTQYEVQSVRPERDPETLRDAGRNYPPGLRERYTQLPSDSTDRLESFTDELTANADSPYEEAQIVEAWMHRSKEYDLNSSHDRSRPLFDEVVFEMDTVYCAYAASGMVGMLRTQDVPARYATGYSSGVRDGGRYAVTEQQAHAWVEVYVPDEGWVPFDPTPPDRRRDREAGRLRNDSESVREGLQRYANQTGARPPGDLGEFRESGSGEGRGTGSGDGRGTGSGGAGGSGSSSQVRVPDVDTDAYQRGVQRTSDGYTVYYNQSNPTPGSELAVSVFRDEEPVSGVVVRFDGEPVGRTDARGAVIASVPWVETLQITVGDASDRADAEDGTTRASTTPGAVAGSAPTGASGSVASASAGTTGADVPSPARSASGSAAQSQPTNDTVELETRGRIDVAVRGTRLPGSTVAVTARIDGRPVPDARISLGREDDRDGANSAATGDDSVNAGTSDADSESVATTDRDGAATVALPGDSGNVTVRVERGEIAGERTVTVEPLTVGVVDGLGVPGASVELQVAVGGEPLADHEVLLAGESLGRTGERGRVPATLPATPDEVAVDVRGEQVDATRTLAVERPSVAVADLVPLPGRPSTVRVEHAGEPVANASVAVGGERRATTGQGGSATVTLPIADSARVSASVADASAATTVSNLYRNAAALGLGALGVVAGVLALVRRRLRGSDTSGRGAVASAGGWLGARLAWLGERARRTADRVVDAAVGLGRALGRLARRLVAVAGGLFDRGFVGLLALPGLLVRTGRWLLRSLDPRRLLAWLRGTLRRGASTSESSSSGSRATYDLDGAPSGEDASEPDPGLLELRDVWRAFVRAVRPPRAATQTVGEIGRYAVGRGLPRKPVRTVVETYRAAEYGRRSPSPNRLRRAAAAVRSVADDPDALDGRLPEVDGDGDGDGADVSGAGSDDTEVVGADPDAAGPGDASSTSQSSGEW